MIKSFGPPVRLIRMRLLVLLALAFPTAATAQINAVVGDQSWSETHGRQPNASDSETARIQTHLAWVGARLRGVDTSQFSAPLRAKRALLLDALDTYRVAARFPRNTGVPGRRPRFVDDRGHLCAVGHLISVSAGPALVSEINAAHEYDYLPNMDLPRLAAWVRESGLTPTELATIQPQYGHMPIQPPRRPALDEAALRRMVTTVSRQTRSFQSCVVEHAPHTTRIALRVIVRVGSARGNPSFRIRAMPRSAALEACVQQDLHRRLMAQLGRFTTSRVLRVDVPLRLATTPRPLPTADQVRSAVTNAVQSHNVRRCLRSIAGGNVTLRIRVRPNGNLQLIGASLPPNSSSTLTCLDRMVRSARVSVRPARATTVAVTITLDHTP